MILALSFFIVMECITVWTRRDFFPDGRGCFAAWGTGQGRKQCTEKKDMDCGVDNPYEKLFTP